MVLLWGGGLLSQAARDAGGQAYRDAVAARGPQQDLREGLAVGVSLTIGAAIDVERQPRVLRRRQRAGLRGEL